MIAAHVSTCRTGSVNGVSFTSEITKQHPGTRFRALAVSNSLQIEVIANFLCRECSNTVVQALKAVSRKSLCALLNVTSRR